MTKLCFQAKTVNHLIWERLSLSLFLTIMSKADYQKYVLRTLENKGFEYWNKDTIVSHLLLLNLYDRM